MTTALRTLALRLRPEEWAWIERELMRRHLRLEKYIAQVLEGEIAEQRQLRGEGRPARLPARIHLRAVPERDWADQPVLAVER